MDNQELEKVISTKVEDVVKAAHALTIVDKASLDAAHGYVLSLKGLETEIDEGYDEAISQAHKLHKHLKATKDKYKDPVLTERKAKEAEIGDFLNRQQSELDTDAANAEAEALIEKEEITEHIATLINEKSELENEEQLLRQAINNEEATPMEKAGMERQAKDLAAEVKKYEDKTKQAQDDLKVIEMSVATKSIAAPVEKPKGTVTRKTYTVDVTGPMVLIKAIAGGTVPLSAITFSKAGLIKLASSGVKLPGCDVSVTEKTSVRKTK